MQLPIATGFYEDRSKPIAAQTCINWWPRIPETNALSKAQLYGTPGIALRSTAGTKTARGIHVMNGVPYIVAGTTLYRENNDGTTTSLGTIAGTSRVSMADNGTQLCIIVPGTKGYIFTASPDTLTEIVSSVFTTTFGYSEQVVFLNGYFVHYSNNAAVGTGVIVFISNLNNGLAYDALDFGSAEADPDKITGIHVSRGSLYVGGEVTRELQRVVVQEGYPLIRVDSGTDVKGVKAKFSLIDFDDGFAFIGGGANEQPAVWIGSGSGSRKISTAAVDEVIRNQTQAQIEDIYCTSYAEGGGYFLNVHMADRTLTYDSLASAYAGKPMWHERRSKNGNGQLVNWRVNGIAEAYGKIIVTDNQSGRVGSLDSDVYTEYGTSINRIVATTPFHNQGENVVVSAMEITCESGVGNITGDEPVIRRRFSDDGGFTFSNATERGLGKQGEYKKRQIWYGEGMFSRTRVYEFSMSDPVKPVIIKLEAVMG